MEGVDGRQVNPQHGEAGFSQGGGGGGSGSRKRAGVGGTSLGGPR